MAGYGAAARAPAVDPLPGLGDGAYPSVNDPWGRTYVAGRSYYAEPATDAQQRGTQWRMVGAFHPAWANPFGYPASYATPATVFHLVGTTMPAAGLDPNTLTAQQYNSPGAAGHGAEIPLGA